METFCLSRSRAGYMSRAYPWRSREAQTAGSSSTTQSRLNQHRATNIYDSTKHVTIPGSDERESHCSWSSPAPAGTRSILHTGTPVLNVCRRPKTNQRKRFLMHRRLFVIVVASLLCLFLLISSPPVASAAPLCFPTVPSITNRNYGRFNSFFGMTMVACRSLAIQLRNSTPRSTWIHKEPIVIQRKWSVQTAEQHPELAAPYAMCCRISAEVPATQGLPRLASLPKWRSARTILPGLRDYGTFCATGAPG